MIEPEVCEGEVLVICCCCDKTYAVPEEEVDDSEAWFCEEEICTKASYKYHLGGGPY
ncbi:hypothetical protein D3C75_136320 [compost metagenome]